MLEPDKFAFKQRKTKWFILGKGVREIGTRRKWKPENVIVYAFVTIKAIASNQLIVKKEDQVIPIMLGDEWENFLKQFPGYKRVNKIVFVPKITSGKDVLTLTIPDGLASLLYEIAGKYNTSIRKIKEQIGEICTCLEQLELQGEIRVYVKTEKGDREIFKLEDNKE